MLITPPFLRRPRYCMFYGTLLGTNTIQLQQVEVCIPVPLHYQCWLYTRSSEVWLWISKENFYSSPSLVLLLYYISHWSCNRMPLQGEKGTHTRCFSRSTLKVPLGFTGGVFLHFLPSGCVNTGPNSEVWRGKLRRQIGQSMNGKRCKGLQLDGI